MCGIKDLTGSKQEVSLLIYVLSKIEYRCYDPNGIAVCDVEKTTEIIKENVK